MPGGAGGASGALSLSTVAANASVGLEWTAHASAETYRVHYSSSGPATLSDAAFDVSAPRTTFVHTGLQNGQTYHYLVTAVSGGSTSSSSNAASATPDGEWALDELGSGVFLDVSTGAMVPRVPLERRIHVLLFAEGYPSSSLDVFHDAESHHDARTSDVDRWVDEIFSITPFSEFREAFVVWYLPRASNTDFAGGDTAFAVDASSGAVQNASSMGETATRAWQAIAAHPFPPSDLSGGGFGSVRTHVAAFLLFDPQRGRAGVSGVTLALRNPEDSQARIAAAMGLGHAHEFSHAFSGVRDEYLEDDNEPPANGSELANVVGSASCTELPWAHLLAGSTFNPASEGLVGAFGTPAHGYHAELLCLMNGTHDNAAYYGGNGLLRTDDRLCNYCRELTAFSVYARSSVLPAGTSGFENWKETYRSEYYRHFPLFTPDVVPQTNDVRMPSAGDPIYEACSDVAANAVHQRRTSVTNRARVAARSGCVIED